MHQLSKPKRPTAVQQKLKIQLSIKTIISGNRKYTDTINMFRRFRFRFYM